MKSLFERAKARPYHAAAWVIAAFAVVAILWWLFCPQASTENTVTASTKNATNSSITQLPLQPVVATSETATTSEVSATENIAPTTPAPIAANTAMPTDPALAEEELDRLKDEHSRLKDRKAQLTQQLDISNKLVVMKEQQLKTLETPNP